MIKANEVQDVGSCWNKAGNDEPVFILRANDECAPDTIMSWARRYMAQKVTENGGELLPHQRAKYQEALSLAYEMRAWKERQR